MRHTTQDTRPSAHPRPAVNPHTTLCDRAGSNDADVRFPPVISLIGCDNRGVLKDFEHRYRAVRGRDARFDGWFYVAVTSTGIYCRPSCPVATPKRSNVRFYPTAAAAQYAGFRAWPRAAAQLHAAPPAPPTLRGGWCRSARARPRAAHPHRQAAHRDYRSTHHRGSVRRRIHEHTPIQRHDPRDLRRKPESVATHSRSS
jgi:methylphosphotriester-DNA--protein-cysteine methyltransferase